MNTLIIPSLSLKIKTIGNQIILSNYLRTNIINSETSINFNNYIIFNIYGPYYLLNVNSVSYFIDCTNLKIIKLIKETDPFSKYTNQNKINNIIMYNNVGTKKLNLLNRHSNKRVKSLSKISGSVVSLHNNRIFTGFESISVFVDSDIHKSICVLNNIHYYINDLFVKTNKEDSIIVYSRKESKILLTLQNKHIKNICILKKNNIFHTNQNLYILDGWEPRLYSININTFEIVMIDLKLCKNPSISYKAIQLSNTLFNITNGIEYELINL